LNVLTVPLEYLAAMRACSWWKFRP